MNAESRYQTIFYATAFILVFVLSVLIFWPFLIVLALSAMSAVIIQPVYQYLCTKLKYNSVSALACILLLIVVIVLPMILMINKIFVESQGLYAAITSGDVVSVDYITGRFATFVQGYVPGFTVDAKAYVSAFSGWVVGHIGGVFGGTIDIVVKSLLFLVALFYFLRDGKEFKKTLMAFSPLPESKDKILSDSLKSAIRSILLGSFVVSLVQGFLCGVGLFFAGVPNFTLWGLLAAVTSLIPGVGTSLVWIPSAIYLYFYGSGLTWVGYTIWSVLLVGFIDNFLSPIIINKGVNIHPLLVLFSILGGVQFFGPSGFLLGPLVVSLLFVLIRIAEIGGSQK